MSNSSLVTYTNITKTQKNSPRNAAIDTITIHCMAAQWTAKTCCDYFANADRAASCNYAVGYDGSIGLNVDERDRSWCTSSSANDNRAVTIEVASDSYTPYSVKDAAYNATIELVVDICKRNGIKKLVWSTDKNTRVNHLNGCNMTVHRDYANKACVPTYTEVLTEHGWARIDEVEIGDKIACATIDGLNIGFDEIYDLIPVKKQDTYTNNGLTATKDHRIVYSRQKTKDFFRIEQYKNLLKETGNVTYIPCAGFANAEGLQLTKETIAFYIAVQADGHYMYEMNRNGEKRYYGVEFYLKKQRKIDRIIHILEAIGLGFTKAAQSNGSTKIRVYNADGVNVVNDICEKYLQDKAFTWEWLNLSEEQAEFFLSEIQEWDGCTAGNLYTSKEKQNLDVVSAIAAINGVGSKLTGSNVYFRETPYITLGTGESSTRRNHRGRDAEVMCVSVKTGIFLIRQNGKTFIVGNCPGDYLYERMGGIAAAVNAKLEEDNMTGEEIYKALTDYTAKLEVPDWAKDEYQLAIKAGITDGTDGTALIPRYQAALMAYRAMEKGAAK